LEGRTRVITAVSVRGLVVTGRLIACPAIGVDATFRPYVYFREGEIRVVDQTRLPGEELAEAISTLRARRAPALGVAGGRG
jgi:hypothetical protein